MPEGCDRRGASNGVAKDGTRVRVHLINLRADRAGISTRGKSSWLGRNADLRQALFRSEHQLRPGETPTGTFESRRRWIKAKLNCVSPFLCHGEPQP